MLFLQLMELGASKEQAEQVLEASGFDLDTAALILFSNV